jgi:hypothetical protein
MEAQRRFAGQIEMLVAQHSIRFIEEEATFASEDDSPQASTIAKTIADRLQLRYMNIDIPLGCKNAIRHRKATFFNDVTLEFEDLLASDKYAKAWNLVREYHMYETALEQWRSCPEPTLLIVGKLHVQPISVLLNRASVPVRSMGVFRS